MADLQAVLRKAEEAEAARQSRLATEQAAEQAARAGKVASAREVLLGWLGDDLAAEFEISAGAHGDGMKIDKELMHWSLRPKAWHLDMPIWVIYYRGKWSFQATIPAKEGFKFDPSESAAENDRFAWLLLEQQRAYGRALEQRINALEKSLNTVREPGCSDNAGRLDDALAELLRLAPERAAEWQRTHEWARAAYDAWVAEQAEQAVVREAAVERYREAMEAWADECEAVRARNAATVGGLRELLAGVERTVAELEYAMVAADDGYGPHVETRTAWVEGINHDTGGARVVENGRGVWWTFRHIVRVGQFVTVRPEYPHGALFLSRRVGDEWVFFTEAEEPLVEATVAALEELPEVPEWDEYGRGLPGGTEVGKIVSSLYKRLRGSRKEEMPF